MSLSRRQILAGAGAAVALAPWAARAAATDVDVAIVGGGVSGVYTAWRLAQERPGLRVRLFEASDRIGGRLHSVAFPQAPHLVAEAGGMRYQKAHTHVAPLVDLLGLASREYPIDRPASRLMLRGKNFSLADVKADKARYPYRVPDKDQSPQADYFQRGIAQILGGHPPGTPAEWSRIRASYRYRGKPLRDWKSRDMLTSVMSAEELALMQDGSGYDDWIDGENGLDEMDFVYSGEDLDATFYTIAGGYQRLPLTLAEQAAKAGATLALRTKLMALEPNGGTYRLTLRDASGAQSTLTAAKVVLALPRRSIETIAHFPERADKRFTWLLGAATPIPACKSLLLYKRTWWRDHGIVEGRSITDLPARQFYCLGSEAARLPGEDTGGYGVLMAYCDMGNVAHWQSLVAKPDPSGFTALPGASPLVADVHREAATVIGPTKEAPVAAYFQDWTAEPFGGGWHYYALGYDGVNVAAGMIKPLPFRELYVCGEAYSLAQGWVEGALERAETMLRAHFGVRKAGWMKS
jgi:lysine 2-monooxygenase